MKKINTLTLNAYRHAVHILNPRHGRDKARHWGTLQTTERLPLARLAGEPRVRPDVCRHEHSPPFGAAEYRTVCKPAAVRPSVSSISTPSLTSLRLIFPHTSPSHGSPPRPPPATLHIPPPPRAEVCGGGAGVRGRGRRWRRTLLFLAASSLPDGVRPH